jgi:hypothetical protein
MLCVCLHHYKCLYIRIETSSEHSFLPSFNTQGQDVWSAWDEYLEKQCKGLTVQLYTITLTYCK